MFFNADGLEKEPPIFYYHIDREGFSRIGNSVFDTIEEEIQIAASLGKYREQ